MCTFDVRHVHFSQFVGLGKKGRGKKLEHYIMTNTKRSRELFSTSCNFRKIFIIKSMKKVGFLVGWGGEIFI